MNLRALLAISIAWSLVACSSPPSREPTASNREEAMRKCHAENEKTMKVIEKQTELANKFPERMRFGPNHLKGIDSAYLGVLPNQFKTVRFIRTYCQPSTSMGKKSFKGLWSVAGYLEYLITPTEKAEKEFVFEDSDSKVDRRVLSYNSWKED